MDALRLLKDKVVVITGASSGIGAGTAVLFARHGCRLVLAGRNAGNLERTRAECLEVGDGLRPDQVIAVTGSVEEEKDCEKLIRAAVDTFGRLDVLVNNAGMAVRGTAASLELAEFDSQMKTNVSSVFLLSKLALPHLASTKGSIVNVSSVVGFRSAVNSLAYSTSKAAVDHLTRNLALEFAGRGVRVNGVSPGLIVTEFQKRAGMPEDVYEKFIAAAAEANPSGRVGLPEHVANAILFLASDMALHVTGSSVTVDGGASLGSQAALPARP
ncbi:hypothetical protein ONE63_004837 [Megalurothrips usitatus]|uniref:Ketoreductase domain-containing protein n=1 Tax=Megalurothrips usitatus TaxID=439358 RepID=A0AAV7X445_9NEOP|nr:hypothetical protein ONE63_004837 [Megalurothrips usitatus]